MAYMAQTSISIRMDAELKKSFEQFCGAVGMNMSTAINMFAIACVRTQKIPFEISAQRALPGESLDLFTDTSWGEGEEEEATRKAPIKRFLVGAFCCGGSRYP